VSYFRCSPLVPVITLVAVSAVMVGCDRPNSGARDSDPQTAVREATKISTDVLAADQEYGAAWLRGDWTAASALTAPNYYGVSADLELDHAGLEKLFPKVRALAYEKQARHVRVLRPDLAVVSYEMTMKEIVDGRDISGRYWYATTWTLMDSGWKLLMEQEIPLSDAHQPPN
jgi:hypothetical protein